MRDRRVGTAWKPRLSGTGMHHMNGMHMYEEGGKPMLKRLLAILAVVLMSTVLVAVPASAHPVGEPGTPSCFGERISHGSSDHGLTPAERAVLLQDVVDLALAGEFGPEAQAFALEFFGDDGVSVGEMTAWVRLNCSDDPFVPPED